MLARADLVEVDQHQCPWCRSGAVVLVVDIDDEQARGRCLDCGRDAPLVPSGLAC